MLGRRLADDDREPGNRGLPLNEGNIGDVGEVCESRLDIGLPDPAFWESPISQPEGATEFRLLLPRGIIGDGG